MTTVLLHGFWGQPSDWTEVIKKLPLGQTLWTPDLYEPGPLAPHHTTEEWCAHFFDELNLRVGSGPVQVVGYSMSGRLLVNLVCTKPERFSRALILSANPLPVERGEFEREWRAKFLEMPWDELEKSWDELSVFSGSQRPPRRRSAMMREMLGQSLINWGPSQNVYLAGELKSIAATVDWAFGALDQKYVSLAKDLATLPLQGQITVIENAGHRIPLDAADWVGRWICKTLSN